MLLKEMEEEILNSIVKSLLRKKTGQMTVDKITVYVLASHLYFKTIMPPVSGL